MVFHKLKDNIKSIRFVHSMTIVELRADDRQVYERRSLPGRVANHLTLQPNKHLSGTLRSKGERVWLNQLLASIISQIIFQQNYTAYALELYMFFINQGRLFCCMPRYRIPVSKLAIIHKLAYPIPCDSYYVGNNVTYLSQHCIPLNELVLASP